MPHYNHCALAGHLVVDPETRYAASGTAITSFRFAVNDRKKDANGEWIDNPLYISCVAFGKTAETVGEYLHKGAPALLDGKLQLRQWTSREGEKRQQIELVCNQVVFLGPKGERTVRDEHAQSHPEEASQELPGAEDAPF